MTVLFADVVHSMDIAAAVGPERLREIMADLADRARQWCSGTAARWTSSPATGSWRCSVRRWRWRTTLFVPVWRRWAFRRRPSGLPSRSHERDGVDLRLRVGLNSGQVIAGEIGSGSFGYTAVGEQVGMAQRMESVAPPGGVMLSASTARLVEGAATLGELSWFRSRVPMRRCLPVGCWAWRNGIALSGVLSRIWSVGAGRCPPSRACWTAQSMATARWLAWSGSPGIGKSRLVREVAAMAAAPRTWRCSPPSANRTPATFPSMSWRGCCAQPPASRVWTAPAARDRGARPGSRRRPRGLAALR